MLKRMTIEQRVPVLVLGLGNLLLRDDGVGLELLRELRHQYENNPYVEFVDGGTQGIALLGHVSGRRAMLLLDACTVDAEPGSVTVLREPLEELTSPGITAHGANASGLLSSASLLRDLPAEVVLVGVSPAELHTGVGLSEPVRRAIPEAIEMAAKILEEMLEGDRKRDREAGEPCTS
jgi:hydrogenase maturation protease